DHASTLLLAPTSTATANLRKEGVDADKIKEVGDVMLDAAIFYRERSEQSDILVRLGLHPRDFVLVTLHRAENVDNSSRLASIVDAFSQVRKKFVWPMHPRTRKKIREFEIVLPSNVAIIEPVGYLDMVQLEKNATVIATDSGGVQKEAYFQKTPCVTLRDETEWVELVDAGANVLVGSDSQRIIKALTLIRSDIDVFKGCLYGDGNAGEKVVENIVGF
ncbi:MAG TPA: UDP-N-acetylglucosamine 2-epimerase, partial [Chryseosolibacter sp.]